MQQKPLESLGALVRSRRGHRKIREVAGEIGIGPATLLRVESGRIPDVLTFGKICKWLEIDPGAFLGFRRTTDGQVTPVPKDSKTLVFSAHLKADQTPHPETVNALAQMLLLASRMQYQKPES